jgi:hypothetical protein
MVGPNFHNLFSHQEQGLVLCNFDHMSFNQGYFFLVAGFELVFLYIAFSLCGIIMGFVSVFYTCKTHSIM